MTAVLADALDRHGRTPITSDVRQDQATFKVGIATTAKAAGYALILTAQSIFSAAVS